MKLIQKFSTYLQHASQGIGRSERKAEPARLLPRLDAALEAQKQGAAGGRPGRQPRERAPPGVAAVRRRFALVR